MRAHRPPAPAPLARLVAVLAVLLVGVVGRPATSASGPAAPTSGSPRCTATALGTQRDLRPRAGRPTPRSSRPSRCSAGPAGAGRVDRAGHGVPGVQAAQPRLRRPRLPRPVPAAAAQGWGTAEQVRDPVYATNAFYDALVKVDGYETMPITEAAQKVQRSAFPEAYADHEPEGRVLASALTGHSPAGLSCRLADAGGAGPPAAVVEELKRRAGHDRARPGDGHADARRLGRARLGGRRMGRGQRRAPRHASTVTRGRPHVEPQPGRARLGVAARRHPGRPRPSRPRLA